MNTIATIITFAATIDKKGATLWDRLATELASSTHDFAMQVCATGEAEWKEANPKATAMPSAWRSAKSVALSAIKAGVALVDENGKAIGKSAVEASIKDAKGEKATLDKVRSTLDTLAKLYAQCDAAERTEARALIASMSIRLYEEAKAQGEVK